MYNASRQHSVFSPHLFYNQCLHVQRIQTALRLQFSALSPRMVSFDIFVIQPAHLAHVGISFSTIYDQCVTGPTHISGKTNAKLKAIIDWQIRPRFLSAGLYRSVNLHENITDLICLKHDVDITMGEISQCSCTHRSQAKGFIIR